MCNPWKGRLLLSVLQHTATHCNTLQHTARCNTLQHTATHHNTLQHTTPHCNTPHHMQHPIPWDRNLVSSQKPVSSENRCTQLSPENCCPLLICVYKRTSRNSINKYTSSQKLLLHFSETSVFCELLRTSVFWELHVVFWESRSFKVHTCLRRTLSS